jgi:hypothetical protein
MVSFLTVWLFAVSLIVTVILALSLWCLSALRTAFALCFNSLRVILLADRLRQARRPRGPHSYRRVASAEPVA